MTDLKLVLIQRDNLTEAQAEKKIKQLKSLFIKSPEKAESKLLSMRLEPDYLFDLM